MPKNMQSGVLGSNRSEISSLRRLDRARRIASGKRKP